VEADYLKEEVLRMLTEPMDKVSCLFQAAFDRTGHPTHQTSSDWAEGTIVIEFIGNNPTSDLIRHTIFSIYEKEWGGKPDGLEVAYNRAIRYEGGKSWIYSTQSQYTPIRLFITSSPRVLEDLVNGQAKVFVLDHKEYADWKSSKMHQAHKRVQHQPEFVTPPLVGTDVDPGAAIPVVKFGLFKL
jgi:hypothetical protein